MRCPDCRNNHRRATGMVCTCGYQFALDPKVPPGWADGRFLAAIRRASNGNRRAYTVGQLHREVRLLRERPKRRTVLWMLIADAVAVVVIAALISVVVAAIVGGVLVLGSLITLRTLRVQSPTPPELTLSLIATWQANGKPLDGLIERPMLETPLPEWPEPDLFDYGAESILVVDDDLAVDVLVRNGFHSANRCIVVSERGYPSAVFARAKELVRERPDVPVYCLHASDAVGSTQRVQRTLGADDVVDLGFDPGIEQEVRYLRRSVSLAGSLHVAAVPNRFLFGPVQTAVLQGVPLSVLFDRLQSDDSASDSGVLISHDWMDDDSDSDSGGDSDSDFG